MLPFFPLAVKKRNAILFGPFSRRWSKRSSTPWARLQAGLPFPSHIPVILRSWTNIRVRVRIMNASWPMLFTHINLMIKITEAIGIITTKSNAAPPQYSWRAGLGAAWHQHHLAPISSHQQNHKNNLFIWSHLTHAFHATTILINKFQNIDNIENKQRKREVKGPDQGALYHLWILPRTASDAAFQSSCFTLTWQTL